MLIISISNLYRYKDSLIINKLCTFAQLLNTFSLTRISLLDYTYKLIKYLKKILPLGFMFKSHKAREKKEEQEFDKEFTYKEALQYNLLEGTKTYCLLDNEKYLQALYTVSEVDEDIRFTTIDQIRRGTVSTAKFMYKMKLDKTT